MFRCGISLFPCEKQKVAMKVFQPSLPLISQASPLNTLPLSPVPRAERGSGTRGGARSAKTSLPQPSTGTSGSKRDLYSPAHLVE